MKSYYTNLLPILFSCLIYLGCFIGTSSAQDIVKMMHYNLLRYGDENCGPDLDDKDQWLSTILSEYQPDILTVNELSPAEAFSNRIRIKGFSYTNAINYGQSSNQANSSIVNNIFYNTDVFTLDGAETIATSPRDIDVYHLTYKSSLSSEGNVIKLTIIVAHFKAGDASSDENQRLASAEKILEWIEQHGKGENIILAGDLNISSNRDKSFEALVKEAEPDIRLIDPANKINGWGGAANTAVLTQSTRATKIDCGITGGLDDRFDLILHSPSLSDPANEIYASPSSYAVFGNDGNSYNKELICQAGGSVSLTTCVALKQMSDHLPITIDLAFTGITVGLKNVIPELSIITANQPFSHKLQVELRGSSSSERFRIAVYNMWGQRIIQDFAKNNDKWQVETSYWAEGLYILQVEDREGRTLTRKVRKLPN